jgi:hypothetical protein
MNFRNLFWKQGDIENSQWLELFDTFPAVKYLFIRRKIAPHIVPALQELVGERVTEVLPALQTLFLDEPGCFQKTIGQFIAGRPVAVSCVIRNNL